MDYHCPICKGDLRRRRLTQAIVARMEIDCPQCKSTIQLNIHRAEVVIVLLAFGAIVGLAAFSYWFHSQALALMAFGAAMLGSGALPLLERTYLRNWPRYRPPPAA